MDILENKLYTISEFCEINRITKPFFHKMKKNGSSPKIIRLGKKVLISGKSIIEWREKMETK